MSTYLKSIGALYAKDYERRLKRCMHCGTEFSDITKRNLRNTCSDECMIIHMVSTRHANNSYRQTDEQKLKKSISVRATYASREVFTAEHRKKFSETMKKRGPSIELTLRNIGLKQKKAGKNFHFCRVVVCIRQALDIICHLVHKND